MKLLKKATLILMALAVSIGLVLTSSQPVSAAVDEPQKCTRWHTVKTGEYLSLIAEQYETSWYSLVEINQLTNPSRIYAGNQLCIFHSNFSSNPSVNNPINNSSARVFAASVKEDQTVTLQGKNLVANSRYDIYLGKYKTDPAIRTNVGSISTDKNGAFQTTVTIPKMLYDVLKIRVSLTNLRGDTSSNWFINATSSANVGGIGSPELGVAVKSVKKGQWVKIDTNNLPANVSFNVYMRRAGANDKKWVLVGTLRDPKGGKVVESFEIPESIKDRSKLEIMVVNDALDMAAGATFDNITTKAQITSSITLN